ncbi:MAG: hypothetical protein Q4B04_03095 [bacterium]|nr:hypothetical protein [bacterium]
MEFAVTIFVGIWICAAGFLAYKRINKDFKQVEAEIKNKEDHES